MWEGGDRRDVIWRIRMGLIVIRSNFERRGGDAGVRLVKTPWPPASSSALPTTTCTTLLSSRLLLHHYHYNGPNQADRPKVDRRKGKSCILSSTHRLSPLPAPNMSSPRLPLFCCLRDYRPPESSSPPRLPESLRPLPEESRSPTDTDPELSLSVRSGDTRRSVPVLSPAPVPACPSRPC